MILNDIWTNAPFYTFNFLIFSYCQGLLRSEKAERAVRASGRRRDNPKLRQVPSDPESERDRKRHRAASEAGSRDRDLRRPVQQARLPRRPLQRNHFRLVLLWVVRFASSKLSAQLLELFVLASGAPSAADGVYDSLPCFHCSKIVLAWKTQAFSSQLFAAIERCGYWLHLMERWKMSCSARWQLFFSQWGPNRL